LERGLRFYSHRHATEFQSTQRCTSEKGSQARIEVGTAGDFRREPTSLCDFLYYAPIRSEPKPELIAAKLRRVPPSDEGLAWLAIAIVAYKDLEHLIQLIRGVYMPHHYIIIHLERRPDPEFERGVREYAMEFNNVVVLKFGSVVNLQNGGNNIRPSNHVLDRF
jgi:hypothetical protein